MSRFYLFDQNNSGGRFREPAINVFIEADTWQEANEIAEGTPGMYFEGMGDCYTCGNRWYQQYTDDEGWNVFYSEEEAREKAQELLSSKHEIYFSKADKVPVVHWVLKEEK